MDRNKLENHNGNSLKELTAEIEKLFHCFNQDFFDGKLELPVMTIQSGFQSRRKSKGWFIKKIWNPLDNQDPEKVISEINLAAEVLSWKGKSGSPEIAITLLHEMIHLYNYSIGIKDVSANGVHNKSFGKAAEEKGLIVEYVKEYPKIWTPDLNEHGIESYKRSNFDESLLNKFRIYFDDTNPIKKSEEDEEGEGKEKKKKLKNLFCPECNSKAYTPTGNDAIFICNGTEENPHDPSQLLEKV